MMQGLRKYVYISWALAAGFALSVVGVSLGVKLFGIIAGACMILYLYLTVTKFACPKCGKAQSLQKMSYAIKNEYHCPHCGERIKINS